MQIYLLGIILLAHIHRSSPSQTGQPPDVLAAISSPRWCTCGLYPRIFMASAAGWPEYPLSTHKCWSPVAVGLGRGVKMALKMGTSSFISCRFTPLTTRESGIPFSSTSTLRLLPFFSPVRGVGTDSFLGEWCFYHRTVYALPLPSKSSYSANPRRQRRTKNFFPPFLEVVMHRTGTSKRLLW